MGTSPPPGRPRRYGTNAEKVDAFRARQESAGYLRREVLVTRETAEQLNSLAAAHGVSATDVGSAMLEFGLQEFERSPPPAATLSSVGPTPPGAGARFAMAAAAVPKSSSSASEGVESNPILRFFAKRRESLNK